jgi:dual-specificity kinase
VLDCLDVKANERLAIKVVRSVPRYLDAAQQEIEILQKIKNADPIQKS